MAFPLPSTTRQPYKTRTSDYLIVTRQREEAERNSRIEQTNYYKASTLKSAFEHSTTESIQTNKIKQRFAQLKQEEENKLESRRDRLKEHLGQQTDNYRHEIFSKETTISDTIDKIRNQVENYRESREKKRLEFVEEKMRQKWRNGCDELRQVHSHQLEKKVIQGRNAQLVENKAKVLIEEEDNKYYAELWEKDRLAKLDREKKDAERRKNLDRDTLHALDDQLSDIRGRRSEEKRLQEEEAALMKSRAEMQRLTAEREEKEDMESKANFREQLNRYNKHIMLQKSKAAQESIDMDLKIVHEMMKLKELEEGQNRQKKALLRQEAIEYQEYLHEQGRLEKEREIEINQYFQETQEAVWRKRTDKWKAEKVARNKLMREVMEGRKMQIEEKLKENQLQQEQMLKEKELRIQMTSEQHHDQLRYEQKLRAQQEYQESLRQQVKYQEERRRRDQLLEQEEHRLSLMEEQKFRKILDHELGKEY